MFLLVTFSAAAGAVFSKRILVLEDWGPWLLAGITFLSGIKIRVRDFSRVLAAPGQLAVAFLINYVLVPAFMVAVARLTLGEYPDLVAGIVITAAMPPGVTSALWAAIGRGNLPLTVSVVSVTSVLTPIMAPLIMLAALGKSVTFDAASMVASLLTLMVLPTVLGVLLNESTRGLAAERLHVIPGIISKLLLFLLVAVNTAQGWPQIAGLPISIILLLFGVGMVVIVLGLAVGYLVAKALGSGLPERLSHAYMASIRNTSAGIVVALAYFGALSVAPIVVIVLINQQMVTLAYSLVFSRMLGRDHRGEALANQ